MSVPPVDCSALRFLVVEDQGFQRWAAEHMLRCLGASAVYSAADGVEALEVVRDASPPIDIVITDLNMPGMDGLAFIRHLGASGAGVGIIVASDQDAPLVASVGTMARAYGVRVLATLQKPLSARKLSEALAGYGAGSGAREPRAFAPGPVFTLPEVEEGVRLGQVEAFFQRKVDLATRELRGAEALARWRHPVHGMVLPEAFIPILETGNHIEVLTVDILRQALRCRERWEALGLRASVAVNVSLASLADVGLAERLTAAVLAQGAEPSGVVLEITETAAASDLGPVLENLARLRMKGFGLSIDDFGTGYSSMKQLASIPFTELKIDRSFVRNAPSSSSSRAILETSLEIARKLGIIAVAEGVETAEEAGMLRALGCPQAQGYLYGRPEAAAAFIAGLAADSA